MSMVLLQPQVAVKVLNNGEVRPEVTEVPEAGLLVQVKVMQVAILQVKEMMAAAAREVAAAVHQQTVQDLTHQEVLGMQ